MRTALVPGRRYLERGQPVVILARWTGGWPPVADLLTPWARSPLRNVLVERADGTRVVRPFRGLRRAAGGQ